MTAVALSILFIASRAPYEIYTLMQLFHQQNYATPYMHWNFETDMIINAIIFVVLAIHPIIYFALNPEYRIGLAQGWKSLDCNQSPTQVMIFLWAA